MASVAALLIFLTPLGAQDGADASTPDQEGQAELETPQERVGILPTLTVTATSVEVAEENVAADIDVLAGDEKRRRQTTSLGASLEHLPGVSNISTGGQAGKPVIRGNTGNRIRVLQNGIGTSYQQFGVRHSPNIDPFLAGRIEVVRGASAILYGSSAANGSVNVLPRELRYAAPGESPVRGSLLYGYESAQRLHMGGIEFDLASGDWAVTGAFTYRDSDGLVVPDVETFDGSGTQPSDIPKFSGDLNFTDFEQTNGTIHLGRRFSGGEFTLRYEGWRNEHNFLQPPGPNGQGIGQELETDVVQATLETELNDVWSLKSSYTLNRNLRLSNPGGTPLPVTNPVIDIERYSHTGRAEFLHQAPGSALSGTVGVEVLYEDQESNGVVGLSPGGQIYNFSVFALERLELDSWTFEGGLRFDHRRQEGDPSQTNDPSLFDRDGDGVIDVPLDNEYNVLTGSVGTLYRFNKNFSIAANVNRGFRAPGLFELYVNGVHGGVAAVQQGNPNLEEETSIGGDLQLRWRSPSFDITATGYVTEYDNYIFLGDTGTTSGGGLPIFQFGQEDATLIGGDVSATWRAHEHFDLTTTYELVRGEFDSGGDVPLLPADKLRVEARYHRESLGFMENPELTLALRAADSKDSAGALEPFSQFDNNPNFGTASTDSYAVLDLGLGFDWKQWRFDFTIANLLDEDYRDFLDTYKGYALSPGRSFNVRVSYEF